MTKVVYVSGVHGVGKTTVLKNLAGVLDSCGLSVYVFPEMSYKPKIPIGTMGFQMWFKKQIQARETMIDALVADNTFDYILLDRALFDIDIYTARLQGTKVPYMRLIKGSVYIILGATVETIRQRISSRDNEGREKWNETDSSYISDIRKAFMDFSSQYGVIAGSQKIHYLANNGTIDEVVNKILELIY